MLNAKTRTYRMLSRARHKNSLSLYKIQKQAKLINGISSQHSGYLWREGKSIRGGGTREASGWWQHSLLTWVVYSFCNDSWSCIHFWSVHFSIRKLHLAYKFKKKTASVTTDHYLDITWTVFRIRKSPIILLATGGGYSGKQNFVWRKAHWPETWKPWLWLKSCDSVTTRLWILDSSRTPIK